MENEFDLGEVEGFEDIPGRPRPVVDSNTGHGLPSSSVDRSGQYRPRGQGNAAKSSVAGGQ